MLDPIDMATLNWIEIENFRSVRQLRLDLRPLNVVIGANGAGKSNLIGAFRLLGQILRERLQAYVLQQGGAASILHYGPKVSPNMSMRFNFAPNNFVYKFVLAPTVRDTLYFIEEATRYNNPDPLPDQWQRLGSSGHEEAYLPEAANGPRQDYKLMMRAMQKWAVYHFHDTSDTSPPKLTQDVDDNRVLRADASNLAAFLYGLQMQHPTEFRRITEHVQRIAPFFAEFQLAPLARSPSKIKLEWRHRQSDGYFDGSSLSDGTLRFICLAALLLQPKSLKPSVILIDEPELGLHPAAITLLAEMLREATSDCVQILAATQSVTLLDHLTPEEVIIAEQVDGASTFKRLDEGSLHSWLEDYSLGELWLKNVLGGRPQ
ncbi:MAG TPA: AAA family ATPase [Acetobacteraceae bacterium]|nr:AAA family ATPase [Acetobacteraceae bacterium]